MARRKRKEDELDWIPPEFDEVGFMRKEIENARIALAVVGWAAVGAIVALLLYNYVNPVVGFLVGVAIFGSLYFLLPALGLPIHGFKRKDWFSQAMIYFFCFLAFFILLLNPPFADHTVPTIQFFSAASYPSTGLTDPATHSIFCVPASAGTTFVRVGQNDTLYVLIRATDNVAVKTLIVQAASQGAGTQNLTPTDVSGRASACSNSPNGTVYAPGTYAVSMLSTGLDVTISVSATDQVGLSASQSFVIRPTT